MPESRIRSVRELRCGVWEVDIIDASRKRLRRRFRAESADGARAAALASLPGPKACTLGEALDRYFEIIAVKGTTKKTIAHYRKECSALGAIAGCAVDSISPAAAAAAATSSTMIMGSFICARNRLNRLSGGGVSSSLRPYVFSRVSASWAESPAEGSAFSWDSTSSSQPAYPG